MESTTTRSGVDLGATRTYPGLALTLALLSIPGSTAAWDAFSGGGFVLGLPPAIAAVVLGVQALGEERRRGMAIAAVVIGGAMVALTVVWTIVSAL